MSRFLLSFCVLSLLLAGCPDDDGPSGGSDTSTADTSGADTGADVAADTSTSDDTGSSTDTATSGDVAGSCDEFGGGSQCNQYPTGLGAAVLESVRSNCPGTWHDNRRCPDGWDAACEDFTAGNLQSQYYYNGSAGMGETTCTNQGGTWQSTLPDYAGSCQKNEYECWDFVNEYDTPTIVQSACDGGTYLADRCPTEGLAGRCSQEPFKVYNYYTGHPDFDRAELFCSQIGGTWESF